METADSTRYVINRCCQICSPAATVGRIFPCRISASSMEHAVCHYAPRSRDYKVIVHDFVLPEQARAGARGGSSRPITKRDTSGVLEMRVVT
jgi:hypothetical protein